MARAKLSEKAATRRRLQRILDLLKREYPEARCSLDYEGPFQLLVATVLSAQCTDERVNLVTPSLFRKYPTPEAMAKARQADVEKLIQSTGFFRSKALSLIEASKAIVSEHGSQVPPDLDKLVKLRGVGRKTANVVLGNAFGVPGFVVDTHIGRLCRRMGFTCASDPVKVEHEMMDVAPREEWTDMGHLFIAHGRAVCTARRAYCDRCPVAEFCPRVGV